LMGEDLGAPIDVLWMRMSRKRADPEGLIGNLDTGIVFVMIDRDDYWQCALVIPKGGVDDIHARGLPAFRDRIRSLVPFLSDRVEELNDWNEIKLLTVAVDRLRTWHRPGLLRIGDAAHAMSPVGGVGINLAIQDAVAAANILAAPLASGRLSDADLRRVERRRELPTRVIQRGQLTIQDRFLRKALERRAAVKVPVAMRLLQWFPALRRIPARIVGVRIRPEHVRVPKAHASERAVTARRGDERARASGACAVRHGTRFSSKHESPCRARAGLAPAGSSSLRPRVGIRSSTDVFVAAASARPIGDPIRAGSTSPSSRIARFHQHHPHP